ncbi:tetratricopeptide repeat protein [Pseudodesulfovibrio sp. zrk46]|uniref:tetratricopeptide repeat protein n=1 Tax=Pseudodesulfovibrio sp. zrk46 TaxID=2725288 RepID=UPI00144A059C|nr:tetratricopeptide repeat protein [Pseudodesulfovibrio sp. zrk46]QJB55808.1 sel1 repeat family protein [Pseudodesulfovibrio sp. zrk46]
MVKYCPLIVIGCLMLLLNPIASLASPLAQNSTAIEKSVEALNNGDIEQFEKWVNEIYYSDSPTVQAGLQAMKKEDYALARTYFEVAANKGNTEAMFLMGQLYRKALGVSKNVEKALYWYHKGADLGDLDIQHFLGTLYFGSEDRSFPHDTQRALKIFKSAALSGNKDSCLMLGFLSGYGLQGEVDLDGAIKWFDKADSLNDPQSQYYLGDMFFQQKLYESALSWFLKAAEQGHTKSMRKVGKCYYQGHGTKQNLVQAYRWLSLGNTHDWSDIRSMLDSIESQITSSEREQAEKLILAGKNKYPQ